MKAVRGKVSMDMKLIVLCQDKKRKLIVMWGEWYSAGCTVLDLIVISKDVFTAGLECLFHNRVLFPILVWLI